jgi:hypothetical protein
MTVKIEKIPDGADERDSARFHIKMIYGNSCVRIVDNKHRKLGAVRSMKLDVSPYVIGESNYAEIFADVVEALHSNGQIANDETAACITFPAGTIEVEIPIGGKA